MSVAKRALAGSLAGFLATIPMSILMKAWHRRLPRSERRPLPPAAVTANLAKKAGVSDALDNSPLGTAAVLAGHFGYGAATGAIYGPAAAKVKAPPAVKGAVYGLAVYAGSYLGYLPALGLIQPATEHPRRRVALMVVAHLVWGASLGVVADALEKREAASPQALPRRRR